MRVLLTLFVFFLSLNSFADDAYQNMKEQLSKEEYEAMIRKETILVDATKMSLDDLRLKYSKEEIEYLLKVTEYYQSPEYKIPEKFRKIKIEE
jgi:Fe-S cluster biosynthesis and repair protein YggX